MNRTLRRLFATLTTIALATITGTAWAPAVSAHPLGNFTVNYHTGLTLHPNRIDARVVVDRAEISALQERNLVDTNHDGAVSDPETHAYAEKACATLRRQLRLSVGGSDAEWKVVSATLGYQPGEAGLTTSRLSCELSTQAGLGKPAGIAVTTAYDTQRIGWREITATARNLKITQSDVPSASATHELRAYPQDPLATPLDQRQAALRTEPGQSTGAALPATTIPGTGLFTGLIGKVTSTFDFLIGAREITIPIGLLALLLAIVLGASHAAMPGHGKTIMAAYLAGRRGTRRDAVTVGATVTLTHTAGVLILGLALPAATHLAGESVLAWLGAASGLLVTAIGFWLLTGALRGNSLHNHHHHGDHGHSHSHKDPEHEHPHHHHGRTHSHDGVRGLGHPQDHTGEPQLDQGRRIPSRRVSHAMSDGVATLALTPHVHTLTPPPRQATRRRGTAGLIGMGVAGGLVPSPSALIVLLGTVALGRTAFGILLVIAYGIGMAATLTLAGLLLVRVRKHLESHHSAHALRENRLARRIARTGPVMTSLLVIAVGFGLTMRAATGSA
ncbi:nickel transporter [Streptomyces sp. NPDC048330]|uniref:HoxN/HupN/NixA family nickel/cobalt transporter n=1 Tax=Streptomyces sp. NPDC048330 TaxID=3365533 RepID=UPI00371A9398